MWGPRHGGRENGSQREQEEAGEAHGGHKEIPSGLPTTGGTYESVQGEGGRGEERMAGHLSLALITQTSPIFQQQC